MHVVACFWPIRGTTIHIHKIRGYWSPSQKTTSWRSFALTYRLFSRDVPVFVLFCSRISVKVEMPLPPVFWLVYCTFLLCATSPSSYALGFGQESKVDGRTMASRQKVSSSDNPKYKYTDDKVFSLFKRTHCIHQEKMDQSVTVPIRDREATPLLGPSRRNTIKHWKRDHGNRTTFLALCPSLSNDDALCRF